MDGVSKLNAHDRHFWNWLVALLRETGNVVFAEVLGEDECYWGSLLYEDYPVSYDFTSQHVAVYFKEVGTTDSPVKAAKLVRQQVAVWKVRETV